MFHLMWHLPKFVDRAVDRLGYWYAAWVVFGVPSMGVVAAWAGSYSSYVSQFGYVGWIFVGLAASLFLSLLILVCVLARNAWINGRRTQRWIEASDTFNPMDDEFRNKRMLVRDLAHPITNAIKKKRLYNCELVGPASLFMYTGGYFKDVAFYDCIVFVLWPDRSGQVFPGNAVVLTEVEMHGGAIYNATILIPPQMIDTFLGVGMKFSTLTGRPEIDSLLQPSTSEETPPKSPRG